jgi:hypothetical protein
MCELLAPDADAPVWTIDFSKIPKFLPIIVGFLISLTVGLLNRTDIFDRLNSLPQDRNEFTPIKSTTAKVIEGNLFIAEVTIDAISPLTFENLFNHVSIDVSPADGPSFSVSAKKADLVVRSAKTFGFKKRMGFAGNFTATFVFFGTPFTRPVVLVSSGAPSQEP